MYLEKVEIENIKGIRYLELNFDQPAGWHVLIGDNASGKTTIMRAISLMLIGEKGARTLYTSWNSWLRQGAETGNIKIQADVTTDLDALDKLWRRTQYDLWKDKYEPYINERKNHITLRSSLKREKNIFGKKSIEIEFFNLEAKTRYIFEYDQTSIFYFSAGYGSFRRLSGEEPFQEGDEYNFIEEKIESHISIFDERYGLVEVIEWLKYLRFQELEKKPNGKILGYLRKILNNSDLLPNNIKLDEVNSDQVLFINEDKQIIDIYDLSDGYRTILSTVFDIIHKINFRPDIEDFFKENEQGDLIITTSGVILIDEIDAHLHPTWQAKIGDWFTKYFPNIQFIVTTHSPIICRAAAKGTIWKLENNNETNQARQIIGLEKDRLVYGNILDALDTNAFGNDLLRSKEGKEKLKRYSELSAKFSYDMLNESEKEELFYLRKIFSTDAPNFI